jgi:cytochrome c oxidase subunit 1
MRKFFSLGLVRGLLWQILGTAIGIGVLTGIRLLFGLPIWKAESAIVFGALLGAMFFLYGVGVLNDWIKVAAGKEIQEHEEESSLGWRRYFGVSLDHKVIGIQYLALALVLMSVGGSFALIFRSELANTGMQFLTLMEYNTLMSLHGMVMIVGILIGVAAFMNYLIPLLIGTRDMAFPRLNAFAFWLAVPAGLILLSSMALGGFDTGWTGYPPLSVRAPIGMQMFFLGVSLAGFSTILGSLNIIVTTIRLRAPGMTPFRMPIFVWASIATSIISLTATQLIGLSFQMVMFQRLFGMGFFDPGKGGNPILFQHLFWFYSHPAVYVFVLPGLGLISEMLPVFARKPLFGYKWVAISSIAIALIGFLVWGHHMFASGMAEYLRVPFMYSTLLVAIPTGVKFFSWLGTLWKGKITYETPMLFLLAGIVVFLLGGLTGPPNATISTDLHLTDTYFIVGHFHDTMFGGYVFPFFAAIFYWFPKMTARRLNEKLGKIQFWLMAPAFIVLSLVMMKVGLLGMRRRIADYDPALQFTTENQIMTVAAFLIALGLLVFFINVIRTLRKGEVATGNVWNSRSPEWQVPSPMPVHNYDIPFEVVGEPYDYGLPGSVYVKFKESE